MDVLLEGTRTAETSQPCPIQGVRKKLTLNFRGQTSTAVIEMAAATLEAGNFASATNEPKQPEIGVETPEGIYAGISPDTGKPFYAVPQTPSKSMKWGEAAGYAKNLGARLPSKGELKILFDNRAKIGGFNVTGPFPANSYWSASEYEDTGLAWCQRFSDGHQYFNVKEDYGAVRCVR
jgi:hypothetical protein